MDANSVKVKKKNFCTYRVVVLVVNVRRDVVISVSLLERRAIYIHTQTYIYIKYTRERTNARYKHTSLSSLLFSLIFSHATHKNHTRRG
jgi:hypothetical protein